MSSFTIGVNVFQKLREMSGFTEEPQFIKPDPLTREPAPPTFQYKVLTFDILAVYRERNDVYEVLSKNSS